MKLSELEPRWIHPNVFAFLCPHCKEVYLTCKNIEMTEKEQVGLYEKEFGESWNMIVVPTRASFSWSISGTRPFNENQAFMDDTTVTPSIDASASGHWHGFITNGEIK